MAWNTSSVTLVPLGWRIIGQDSSNARTVDAMPVRILHAERVDDFEGKGLDPQAVGKWLESRNFRLTEHSEGHLNFVWEDMEVFIGIQETEVAEVTLTFLLKKDSPSRWRKWKELSKQLCEAWDLAPFDSYRSYTVDPDDIFAVLASTPAWKEFASGFGWPPH